MSSGAMEGGSFAAGLVRRDMAGACAFLVARHSDVGMIIESKDSEFTGFCGEVASEDDVSPSAASLIRETYIVGEVT
jgi:hypothetical protein